MLRFYICFHSIMHLVVAQQIEGMHILLRTIHLLYHLFQSLGWVGQIQRLERSHANYSLACSTWSEEMPSVALNCNYVPSHSASAMWSWTHLKQSWQFEELTCLLGGLVRNYFSSGPFLFPSWWVVLTVRQAAPDLKSNHLCTETNKNHKHQTLPCLPVRDINALALSFTNYFIPGSIHTGKQCSTSLCLCGIIKLTRV